MKALAVALLLLAQENPIVEGTASKFVVCDTEEQVYDFFNAVDAGKQPMAALRENQGCGVIPDEVPVQAFKVGSFRTEKAEYVMVRYLFPLSPQKPQFGAFWRKIRGISA